ncbi:MAG TPA: hypothetical protein VNO75_07140 [Gemmatimonadaceae bacterium]|nr:hypothetical protein [Gemmatimonadaceae bacterium]
MPEPATRVVANLTDTGVVAMSGVIGTGAYEIEGVIAEADASTWKVQLTRVEQRGGSSVIWNRELVSFPRSALTNATEKRLSRSRSIMAAGLVTAGVVVAAIVFGDLGADEEPNPPIPPPAFRAPGRGFRLGF